MVVIILIIDQAPFLLLYLIKAHNVTFRASPLTALSGDEIAVVVSVVQYLETGDQLQKLSILTRLLDRDLQEGKELDDGRMDP